MTNNVVRGLGVPGGAGGPLGKRGSHRLSDGSLIMVVVDGNKTGVTGATGDGTGITKIYIYQNLDTFGNAAWTLKTTITTAVTGYMEYSSAIDSANSVHITWVDGATIKYVRASYSGGAYTAGAITTILTVSTPFVPSRVDIDCFANNQAIVAVGTISTGSTTGVNLGAKATAIVLSAAGAAIYTRTIQTLSGVAQKSFSEDITITATHEAAVGNVGNWILIAGSQPASGIDSGDYMGAGGVNLSTGVEVGFAHQIRVPVNGKQYRRYMLFCANGSKDIIYAYISAGTGATYGYRRGTINTDYTITWTSSLVTSAINGPTPDIPGAPGFLTTTAVYEDNTSGVMTFIYSGLSNTAVLNVTAKTYTGTFRSGPNRMDQGFTPLTGALQCLSGGSNRNFASGQVNVLSYYTKAGFYARFQSPAKPLAPANVVPADGATVQTGLPSLGQDFRLPYSTSPGAVNAFYYIAQDAGLSTNRMSVLSPTTYNPVNTDPAHLTKVTDLYSLAGSPSMELSQGAWFVAGYTIDEWGNSSPASSVHGFTVSHPPAPSYMNPSGGLVLSSGSGTVSFSWRFTDPYVMDFQTGFQLQIQDGAGNSVYDSGVVISGATSANISIDPAYRDIQLQWRLSLLDKDGVQGNFSGWQVFYVSDPPIALITTPSSGQVFTTGVPVITWTNGIGVNKSQMSYAVRITDTGTGLVVYYSNVIASSDTSHTVPTGFIHNGKTYLVSVTLKDSLGLVATSAVVGFVTSWTPPNPVDIVRAYLFRYATDGYVFIGWSSANIDARFVAWNLYRRIIGDANWTQLEAFSNIQSSYGYRDYDVKSGKMYQYSITQVVLVEGDEIESTPLAQSQVTIPSASYWIVDPLGVIASVPIFSVTSDKYTNEQESSTYNVIGVGRHVDEGDNLGVNGSLTIELRDKATGLTASINQFLNPAMQSLALVNAPANWTIAGSGTSGSITTEYLTFYEPAPNGYMNNLIIRSDALGNASGDAITITQSITVDRLPAVPGTVFDHAEWLAVEIVTGSVSAPPIVKSKINYYSASGTALGTETVSAVQIDTYEPFGSGDANTGAWQRYKARHTMPLNTDHMTVQTMIQNTTAGAYGIILGGSSLEKYTTAYFDGASRGADWTGAAYSSSSYTTGYYTATAQREDIEEIKKIGRPVILKTPFGQSFYVKLPDNDFDRLAGVTAEFGTMTLPYLEVAF